MVMQDSHMFHDTIRANLQYAKPGANDSELNEALEAAQLLTLVNSLPKGLETVVGERGHRLSGGERSSCAPSCGEGGIIGLLVTVIDSQPAQAFA
jgi:ATP-binding cassette, subfamily B, bacterial